MFRRVFRPLLTISCAAAAIAAAISAAAGAQVVRGAVAVPGGGAIPGAVILLVDSTSVARARTITNGRGEFVLTAPSPGTYRMQVLRVGFQSQSTEVFALRADTTMSVAAGAAATPLAPLEVRDGGSCHTQPAAGAATSDLWNSARTALLASDITLSENGYRFDVLEHSRLYAFPKGAKAQQLTLFDVEMSDAQVSARVPWRSLPADTLAARGYATFRDSTLTLAAPDLEVLLSPYFANTHCFRVHPAATSPYDGVGLDFEPLREVKTAEIRGTLWLDRASRELRSLMFNYVNLGYRGSDSLAGGRVEFARIDNGAWIATRWIVRGPVPTRTSARLITLLHASKGEGAGPYPVRKADPQWTSEAVRVVGADVVAVRRADAPMGSKAVWSRPTGSIAMSVDWWGRGASGPARGAIVRVVGTGLYTFTDSTGSAVLERLQEGEYLVDVTHPIQEALLGPPQRHAIAVRSGDTSRRQAQVLTPAESRAALCKEDTSLAVVAGMITRDGNPVARALVASVRSPDAALDATLPLTTPAIESRADGRYCICRLPWNAEITVSAVTRDGQRVSGKVKLLRENGAFTKLDLEVRP